MESGLTNYSKKNIMSTISQSSLGMYENPKRMSQHDLFALIIDKEKTSTINAQNNLLRDGVKYMKTNLDEARDLKLKNEAMEKKLQKDTRKTKTQIAEYIAQKMGTKLGSSRGNDTPVLGTPDGLLSVVLSSPSRQSDVRSKSSMNRPGDRTLLQKVKVRNQIKTGATTPVMPVKSLYKETRRSSLPKIDSKYYQHLPNLRHLPNTDLQVQPFSSKRHSSIGANEKDKTVVQRFQSDDVDEVVAHIIGIKPKAPQDMSVSFGRHVSVPKDRAQERKLIMQRKNKINKLIQIGLKYTGFVDQHQLSEPQSKMTTAQALENITEQETRWEQLPTIGQTGFNLQGQQSEHETANVDSMVHTGDTFSPDPNGCGSPFIRKKTTLAPIIVEPKTKLLGKTGNISPTMSSIRRKGRDSVIQSTLIQSPAIIPSPKLYEISEKHAILFHRIDPQIIANQNKILDQNTQYVIDLKNRSANISKVTGTMFSTFNQVPDDMQQWQKQGKFPVSVGMRNDQQRAICNQYGIEKDEAFDLLDDPRLLSLAKIKVKSEHLKTEESDKQRLELEEIVKFLLSQVNAPEPALVTSITNKLIKKVYSKSFNDFVQDEEALATDFLNQIRQKQAFYDMCKDAGNPEVKERNKDNYLFKYYEECKKNDCYPLPIFFKINYQRLDLRGYVLNDGVCKAFAEAIKLNPIVLNEVVLEDNQFSDDRLGIFMRGLLELEQLRAFHLKNNEVLDEGLELIQQFLVRTYPNNLEELRLISIKTSPLIISKLMESLTVNCQLKKLSLIGCQLSDANIPRMVQMIDDARFLIDLDISWSGITSAMLLELTTALAENRTLQYLNLSWNFLTSAQKNKQYEEEMEPDEANLKEQYGNQPLSSRIPEETSKSKKKKSKEEEVLLPGMRPIRKQDMDIDQYEKVLEKENDMHDMKDENLWTVENLERFIKRNRSLIHLDLTQTNLTEFMLWRLGKALARGKSLVSIHFSGNQGITHALKHHLLSRIRCREVPQMQRVGLDVGMDYGELGSLVKSSRKMSMYMNQEKYFRENMLVRKNKQKLVSTSIASPNDEVKLIFERQLGHKKDLPGSGQWRQLTRDDQKCWVCEKETYALGFWTKNQGKEDEDQITTAQEENLIKQIEEVNNKFEGYEINSPVFFSPMTSWKPHRLMTAADFAYSIDRDAPDLFKLLKETGKLPATLENKEDMTIFQKEVFTKYANQYKQQNYTSSDDIKKVILRDLKYPKMHFINPDLMLNMDEYYDNVSEQEDNEVYIFAGFMRPGRQCYAIAAYGDHEDGGEVIQYYTHKVVIPHREDEVLNFAKEAKTQLIVRSFNKLDSVFGDWKADTEETANTAIENDLKLWHCDKFIKDPDELEDLANVIRKYSVQLKNIFIQVASKSQFPQIGWGDFTLFSNKTQLPDKQRGATPSIIDTIYIAANNGSFPVPFMSMDTLMRYKFFELLARIAKCKYIETGKEKDVASSMKRLIEEVLLVHFAWEPWQKFRDDKLWTWQVNDVFKVNIEGIMAIQEYYYKPKERYMAKKDAINLMTRDTHVSMFDKDAMYCYGMSKMTVVDEVKHSIRYEKFQLSEFCEFIARVADIKYKDPEIELPTKIEHILDDIFKLIHFKRKDIGEEAEEVSASDSDY